MLDAHIDVSRITPARNLLLLDTTPEDEITPAGVVVPYLGDKAKKEAKSLGGVIVAVGPDVGKAGRQIDSKGNHYFHTDGIKPGARVMVRSYFASHFFAGGRRYHYAEASQVLGIINS